MHHHIPDHADWLSLEKAFKRCSRIYSAQSTRSRLAVSQQILDLESSTEPEEQLSFSLTYLSTFLNR